MTEEGKVDLDYMERLTGMSVAEITDELEYKELFWNGHTRSFQSADEYLSGDIREKMEYLEKSREVILDQINREIWDSLIPPSESYDDKEYVYKNETEQRLLDSNSSFYFTTAGSNYLNKTTDWDFCFAFLKKGRKIYYLPDKISSNPLFCLEAGLMFGNDLDSSDGVSLLTEIVEAMKIQGLRDSFGDYVLLDFLKNSSNKEYPQKRAAIGYLRELLKDYNGVNGEELVARAEQEWPHVWKEFQDKYDDVFKKGELFGLSNMKADLERVDRNYDALKSVCPKDFGLVLLGVRRRILSVSFMMFSATTALWNIPILITGNGKFLVLPMDRLFPAGKRRSSARTSSPLLLCLKKS